MSDYEIPEEITRRLRPLGEGAAPAVNPALAAFLAEPVVPLTEKGDLSATAASNVNGPALASVGQAAGLPKRRRTMKLVLGNVLGAVSRTSLVAKAMLGAGVLVVAGMGSAAAVGAVVDTPATPPVVQITDEPTDVADDPADDPADDQGEDPAPVVTDEPTDDADDQGDDADDQGDDADDQGDDAGDDSGSGNSGSGSDDDDGDDDSGSGSSGSGSDDDGGSGSGSGDDQGDD